MTHRMHLHRAVVAVALAAAGGCGGDAPRSAVSTPLRPADCTEPSADIAARYATRDLGVQECPALDPWRLLVVASDANSWIDLVGPEVTWSSERPIVYEVPLGHFPNLDASADAEWRRTGDDPPTALIVRITAQDPETMETSRSALYVIRLSNGRACLIGREPTIDDARTLADSDVGCPTGHPGQAPR